VQLRDGAVRPQSPTGVTMVLTRTSRSRRYGSPRLPTADALCRPGRKSIRPSPHGQGAASDEVQELPRTMRPASMAVLPLMKNTSPIGKSAAPCSASWPGTSATMLTDAVTSATRSTRRQRRNDAVGASAALTPATVTNRELSDGAAWARRRTVVTPSRRSRAPEVPVVGNRFEEAACSTMRVSEQVEVPAFVTPWGVNRNGFLPLGCGPIRGR